MYAEQKKWVQAVSTLAPLKVAGACLPEGVTSEDVVAAQQRIDALIELSAQPALSSGNANECIQ